MNSQYVTHVLNVIKNTSFHNRRKLKTCYFPPLEENYSYNHGYQIQIQVIIKSIWHSCLVGLELNKSRLSQHALEVILVHPLWCCYLAAVEG
ncbi:hypothetical protein QL285_036357 [Trifolium repens]|nr:hypothetical protein QL285_036357 [Trifolium repens]